MKKIVSIATACAAAFAALGFSSAAWLEKRGDDSDVLRLRAAYSDCVKRLESPAENVSIPIETFPDGTVKSRVTAARAHMFPDTGLVWGEKVHVEQFKEEVPLYMVKHQVRPGMTGWAQVNGWRGDTSIEKRIEFDVWYIENWSIRLDLLILLKTALGGFINHEQPARREDA